MHALSSAGAFTFMLLTCFLYKVFLGADIIIANLCTGLICASRLLLNNHTNREVYIGFFTGMACQMAAYWMAW